MNTRKPDIYDLAFQSDDTDCWPGESEVEQLSQTDVDLFLMGQHDMMAMSGATYYVYGPPPELYDTEAEERRRKRRRERNRRYRARKRAMKKGMANGDPSLNTAGLADKDIKN